MADTYQDLLARRQTASVAFALGTGASVLGAFFEAKSRQYGFRAAALRHGFEQLQVVQDARNAEADAVEALEASRYEIGRMTMAAGRARSARTVATAARGIELSSASVVEAQASDDIVTEADRFALSLSGARAAAAARRRGDAARAAGDFAAVSERNARRSARLANPFGGIASTLLSSATNYAILRGAL